jgi:hypothetical protein
MATDYSLRFNYSPCLHRHIVTVTTGGMHFTNGEVWDDIQELLLCLDCDEYLTEPEIRARWNGSELGDAAILSQKEDDDAPF